MLQTLFWRWMLCFLTFLKYLLAVLAQTPATYILMYCNASSMAFPALHCFQFIKKTSDVFSLTSNVRRLIWDVCCHIIFLSDVWFYMLCYITVIRCLMSDFMLCYITVIRHLMSNIRRVITVIWQHTSDVKRLTRVIWQHTSDDKPSDIRHLITVTWEQTSDVRCLLSYNWYQTSDAWFYMLCYITVIRCLVSNIRRLVTVIWQQMSDNSYMTADVWCQTSAVI